MTRHGRFGLTALAVVAFFVLMSSVAYAGGNQTISMSGGSPNTLTWTGGSDNNTNANDDSVTFADGANPGDVVVTTNSSSGIDLVSDPNENCTETNADDPTSWTCTNVDAIVANAGAGNDTVDASGISSIPTTLNGDDGNDSLYGGGGADTINGGAGDDYAEANGGNDTLNGGDGNDQMYGGAGDDTMNGDAGDDTLYGGDGNDTMNGGDGNDSIYGEWGNDFIHGNAGDDYIEGGPYGAASAHADGALPDQNTIYGDDGNDEIYGGDQADAIDGGDGTDLIHGEGGDDVINGGPGNDAESYNWQTSGWTDGGLYGDDGNDTINGGDGIDALYGGAGDDTMDSGAGDDAPQYRPNICGAGNGLTCGSGWIYGGAYGEDGNDTMHGGDGVDYVEGGAGNDTEYGDAGDDAYRNIDYTNSCNYNLGAQGGCYSGEIDGGVVGDQGDDKLDGGDGRDYVDGGDGNDIVNGGPGDDTWHGWNDIQATGFNSDYPGLYGGAGDDQLNGGDGSDYLEGGSGSDLSNGGAGDDQISEYNDGSIDNVNGGPGIDEIDYYSCCSGNPVNITLDGQANDGEVGTPAAGGDPNNNFGPDLENVVFYTECFSNCSTASTPPNAGVTIVGTSGANLLYGSAGNDDITGGDGADYMNGGAGDDTFHAVDGYPDYVDCGSGVDTAIVDQFDTVHNCENVTVQNVPSAFAASNPPTPPTPPAGPTGPPKDTIPPTLNLNAQNTITGNQLVLGVRVSATCSEDCALSLRLLAQQEPGTATFARAKGYNVVVGRRYIGFGKSKRNIVVRPCERTPGGPQSPSCLRRFTKALNARLAKAGKVTMKLYAITTDRAGNRTRKIKTITIRKVKTRFH